MKLGIRERLLLYSILPTKSNYQTFEQIKNLKDNLLLTQEEVEKFEVKYDQNQNMVTWNVLKEKEKKEIEINNFMYELISSILNKINEENKIDDDIYNLYSLFIVNKKE